MDILIKSKCPECGFETSGSRFPNCYSCGEQILEKPELITSNAQLVLASDDIEISKQRDCTKDEVAILVSQEIIEAVINIGLSD